MREIKFRAWEKNTKNKYHEELRKFRSKLYKEGKRFGNNRYEYENITLKMWEEESKKKYSEGVVEYYEMNYSPHLVDLECLGEFSLCNLNNCLKEKDKVFMQYTGLKDKKEKEIYEGDVVRISGYSDGLNKHVNEVKEVEDIRNVFLNYNITNAIDAGLSVEVIGNIYENPELPNN